MTYIPGTFTFPPIQIFNTMTENQIKIVKKQTELIHDCIKHGFCPICTNHLYDNGCYCYECQFYIDHAFFAFKINNIVYSIFVDDAYLIKVRKSKSQKVSTIYIEDFITDIDNLTLIQLYNNLTKFVTFQ